MKLLLITKVQLYIFYQIIKQFKFKYKKKKLSN